MQQAATLKKLLLGGISVAAAYFILFYAVEHWRRHRGPWEITFASPSGTPTITINHKKLNIENVRLSFPGQSVATNLSETIRFNESRPVPFDVPFGQCVFLDNLTLPGNVTLHLYHHEIQLLPRVLTLDGQERAWQSDTVIPLKSR